MSAGPFPLEGGYETVGWLRAHAIELGAPAIPSLEVVAKEGAVPLRAAALLAMTEIDPEATEAFVVDRARHDPAREVREAATRALGRTRGDASLAFLLETDEDRAARIALHERLGWLQSDALTDLVRAAGPRAAADRRAAVCLELLASRKAVPEELAFELVRRHATTPPGEDDDPDEQAEADRAVASLLQHANAARVLEELAPIVEGGRRTMAVAIVEMLESQMEAAWSSHDGFDDDQPPVGLVPDARWREVLARFTAPSLEESHTRLDLDLLKAGLEWTYLPRVNRALRRIESGAEEGAAFVVAGFDVSQIRDDGRVVRALDGLGGRAITNLHWVMHQCAGHGCSQFTLLGLPLASKALSAHLAPDSKGVTDMLAFLPDWRAADPTVLVDVHERLVPFLPTLPPLVGGVEALVWTAPGDLALALEGVEVVRILPTVRPWREESGFFLGAQDVMRSRGPYEHAHQQLLEDVGARLGLGMPSVFVLWANSD